ncbi:hypothetical protein [Xylanibacillus composti]|uniref:hypothetical protein n=1 Tax=Xylanibacillus composti TaxID=1572762 RepID=UPI001BCDF95E|nr:hypothetical protein [Xylanibacillus composti]
MAACERELSKFLTIATEKANVVAAICLIMVTCRFLMLCAHSFHPYLPALHRIGEI